MAKYARLWITDAIIEGESLRFKVEEDEHEYLDRDLVKELYEWAVAAGEVVESEGGGSQKLDEIKAIGKLLGLEVKDE